ncbi:hypothetical protein [Chryseobacterium sp. SIMBA_038]|uniref:hypothetical protein n=1 Tax=Chryseobacterium sp. SIMBA_038 TaxID=3085780 RepID=UPI0039794D89
MQNYRKLLFAGLAIVPLALSSWTSTGNDTKYGNGDAGKLADSSIEIIGDTAVSSSVTVKTKKKVLSVSTIEEVSVAEKKAISVSSIDTTLSFNEIVNNYK